MKNIKTFLLIFLCVMSYPSATHAAPASKAVKTLKAIAYSAIVLSASAALYKSLPAVAEIIEFASVDVKRRGAITTALTCNDVIFSNIILPSLALIIGSTALCNLYNNKETKAA